MRLRELHLSRLALSRFVVGWGAQLCVVLLPFLAAGVEPTLPKILTNVQQVRELTFGQARLQQSVRIRGVITFHDASNNLTYVQDETAGIHVRGSNSERTVAGIEAGQLVEVEGFTSIGSFSPIVVGAKNGPAVFHVLGRASFPHPTHLSSDSFSQIPRHCQWVEIGGLVRAVNLNALGTLTVIEIQGPLGRMKLYVAPSGNPADELTQLVAGKVRAQGVFSVAPNLKMQSAGMHLLVPSAKLIIVERAPKTDPFSQPVRPVENLLRFNLNEEGERIRLQGTVTLQVLTNGFFIRDKFGGVWIQSRQAEGLIPGDRVDVVGFPGVGEGYAVLEDAIFRRLDREPPPNPTALVAAQVISGAHHAELVSFEATLLEHLPGVEEHVLVMQSGGVTIHARLPVSLARKDWIALKLGGYYRATGVALLRPNEQSLGPELPLTFKLRLRDPSDLVLLDAGPWLTLKRILWLLTLSMVLLLAAFGWVVLLRRQVRHQTSIIHQQLAEQAKLDERSRIARELHDSLGQDMAGVTIQLDAAAARLIDRPGNAMTHLNMARAMMRHAQAETRRSMWSLRVGGLENHDLPSALRLIVAPLASTEAGPVIEVQVAGVPYRFSCIWETHLLRIAQEAVTNAVNHSRAKKVTVELIYDRDRVILRVADDGCGFNAEHSTALSSGHFGLLGMRERAEKMSGRLIVMSSPDMGTSIRVEVVTGTVPLAPAVTADFLTRD